MTYLPIARKYRPQIFTDLIGQPHVTATLTRALESQRIAQAYLFTGMRGIGKTSAARILAKCLNCAKGPTAAPCHRCDSCAQIAAGSSLDVIEIDGASHRGIDEIRSLRETVPFAPTTGRFRVYIIDEVHMLTAEAFNALLKTLEEPPAHVKFIFATTVVTKVPATILSRCQRFDFRRIEAATMVAALQRIAAAERMPIDESGLYAIARASDGSLRDGEVILEQLANFAAGAISEQDVAELLGTMESSALRELTQAMLDRNVPAALSALAGQLERGRDAPSILSGLLRHGRNLLVFQATHGAASRDELLVRLIDEPPDRLARLAQQAGQSTPQELLVFLQVLTAAYEMVRRSPLAQTILELAVIKLCTRDAWESLEQISRRLDQLSRLAAPAAAPSTPAPEEPRRAEPVQQPASSTPEALLAIWPAFLERLGAQKMSLAAYLMHAKPLQLDGKTLTIGLAGFSLHHEVLSVTENRRLIDQLLTELCQTAIAAQYVTLPDAAEPPSAADVAAPAPPIVQDIVTLFNATVINRPPRAA